MNPMVTRSLGAVAPSAPRAEEGITTGAANAATPEGTIWEVDPNLRPEGKNGALVRTLNSHLDREYTLSEFQGHKNVVLVFFPWAWTPV